MIWKRNASGAEQWMPTPWWDTLIAPNAPRLNEIRCAHAALRTQKSKSKRMRIDKEKEESYTKKNTVAHGAEDTYRKIMQRSSAFDACQKT